jgi:hypothetical protein
MVTRKHVITVYHNILDESESRLSDYFVIGKSVEKINGEDIMQNPIEVSYEWGNQIDDIVFLKIIDEENYLADYLPICCEEQLPNPHEDEREKLKAYHAPIGQYMNNEFTTLNIWADEYRRVHQYNTKGKRILVDGGLYRGSCGGPYVNHDGLVVAMHVASMHEGKNISIVKKRTVSDLYEDLENLTSSVYDLHHSVREGVVLARSLDAMAFIRAQNSSTG